MKGACTTCASLTRKAARVAADTCLGSGASTPCDRISTEPKIGPIMVATELNACARVRRLDALAGSPSWEASGLAATCTVVTPLARMKRARRNPG